MKPFVIMLSLGMGAMIASAQATETVRARDFGRDPMSFLNRTIRLERVGCFSAEGGGYKCTTYGGVYLLPSEIAPISVKTSINDQCGGLVENEDDPSCLFDAVFTPLAASTGVGVVTKGDSAVDGPVWMVQAGSVTLIPRP